MRSIKPADLIASLILFHPPQADRLVTSIRFYNAAAAGAFGAEHRPSLPLTNGKALKFALLRANHDEVP